MPQIIVYSENYTYELTLEIVIMTGSVEIYRSPKNTIA